MSAWLRLLDHIYPIYTYVRRLRGWDER